MSDDYTWDMSTPGDGWDDEDLDDASRRWGAPEELLPYLRWQRDRWVKRQAPIVAVNETDEDGNIYSPPMDLVREALRAGAGLYVYLSKPFDLREIGAGLHTLDSFRVVGFDSSLLHGAELVSEMQAAQRIALLAGLGVIDMSNLESLRAVRIGDTDQLSALEAPKLIHAQIQIPRLPRDFQLPAQLVSIALETKRADLTKMGDRSSLRSFFADGLDHVDLAPLADAENIDTVSILRCRSVSNLRALAGRHLDRLDLYSIREADDTKALLDIEADYADLAGAAFDAEFAARLNTRYGWTVQAARPRGVRIENLFQIEERDDHVELVLSDFTVVADQLGIDEGDLYSDDIEALAHQAILAHDPNPDIVLDSEADAVYLRTPSIGLAREYSAAIDKLFANRRTLRAAYRKLSIQQQL